MAEMTLANSDRPQVLVTATLVLVEVVTAAMVLERQAVP